LVSVCISELEDLFIFCVFTALNAAMTRLSVIKMIIAEGSVDLSVFDPFLKQISSLHGNHSASASAQASASAAAHDCDSKEDDSTATASSLSASSSFFSFPSSSRRSAPSVPLADVRRESLAVDDRARGAELRQQRRIQQLHQRQQQQQEQQHESEVAGGQTGGATVSDSAAASDASESSASVEAAKAAAFASSTGSSSSDSTAAAAAASPAPTPRFLVAAPSEHRSFSPPSSPRRSAFTRGMCDQRSGLSRAFC
jgi:hypothetical protein